MPLTHWVEWDKEMLNGFYPKPGYRFTMPDDKKKPIMLYPPLTSNYQNVGRAFDWTMRLVLARINNLPQDDVFSSLILDHFYIYANHKRYDYITTLNNKMDKYFSSAITNLYSATLNIIPDCIILGNIEVEYRTGYTLTDEELFNINQKDIKDISQLIKPIIDNTPTIDTTNNLVTWNTGNYIPNPHFGQSSRDIRGADGDIILSNLLIDIKTTMELKFRANYWRQLVGYYLLNLREKNMNGEIDFLGVYFSRYGILAILPAPIIEDSDWEYIEDSIKQYQDLFEE